MLLNVSKDWLKLLSDKPDLFTLSDSFFFIIDWDAQLSFFAWFKILLIQYTHILFMLFESVWISNSCAESIWNWPSKNEEITNCCHFRNILKTSYYSNGRFHGASMLRCVSEAYDFDIKNFLEKPDLPFSRCVNVFFRKKQMSQNWILN